MRNKRRAIALAGGGPAAGFHIGALQALEDHRVTFDVWSLSCIGAWVGVYYNQLTREDKAKGTYEFFEKYAFRDTASYLGFPVNKAFAPNLQAYATAWMKHSLDPLTYWKVFNFGQDLRGAAEGWTRFLMKPEMWFKQGDWNAHVLNDILAVHPMSRFLTSFAYLSEINGLSNIYYKDSSFLDEIKIGNLDLFDVENLGLMSREELDKLAAKYKANLIKRSKRTVPEIYHNAWCLADPDRGIKGELKLFNNRWLHYRRRKRVPDYLPISRASLCACSALPYIEQTVQIPNDNDNHYSEGALVDTVNFRNLVEDHHDLDEIWVCRIADNEQVRLPKNLHDSLGNLCEQFAAEVGENDIKLFMTHLRKSAGRIPRVVEIPLKEKTEINYRWDHANLKKGYDEGFKAVKEIMARQPELAEPKTSAPQWPSARRTRESPRS